MSLRNRQEKEESLIRGVNLMAHPLKLQLGYFTSLTNWIPSKKWKIKKKRGVATFTSAFSPPLSFPEPVVSPPTINCGSSTTPTLSVSGNGKMDCEDAQSVTITASGGLPPYTWSTTGGILSATTGNPVTLTPAANPGSSEPGTAYESRWLEFQCSSPFNGITEYRSTFGCNDASISGCQALTGCNDSPPNDCPEDCPNTFFVSGLDAGNLICINGGPCSGACGGAFSATPACSGTCAERELTSVASHVFSDMRTAEMITAGCAPCHSQFAAGVVITVTDSIGTSAFVTIF